MIRWLGVVSAEVTRDWTRQLVMAVIYRKDCENGIE